MGAVRSKHVWRGWALAAAVGFGLIAGGSPAQAQFFGSWGYRRMEPPPQIKAEAVVQRLSRSGFKVLQIRPNGGVFLVDAKDQSARLIRLVVDARDGAILQRYAMVNPRGGVGESDAGAFAPAAPAEGAPPAARPRSQGARVKPAPPEATVAAVPENAPSPVQAPVTVAAPPPAPAPLVGPGYANGVPINPLD